MPRCVPMVHVPDVRATIQWYRQVGFEVVETYSEGGDGLSFAVLRFGDSQVMFNSGGRRPDEARRDVDLYLYTEQVDLLHTRLDERVEVVEGPHDTFYGMREVILRDPNGFWVTFGEPSAAAILMHGVRTRDLPSIERAIARGVSREHLAVALAAARATAPADAAVIAAIEATGAVAAPALDAAGLQRYAGAYAGDGQHVSVIVQDGQLLAFPGDASGVSLLPLDATRFKPAEVDDGLIEFVLEGDVVTGLAYTQAGHCVRLRRTAG